MKVVIKKINNWYYLKKTGWFGGYLSVKSVTEGKACWGSLLDAITRNNEYDIKREAKRYGLVIVNRS